MKLLMLFAAILFAAAFGMASHTAMAASSKDMSKSGTMLKGEAKTMDGYIIDTKCASAKKESAKTHLDTFAKTYSKDCQLACRVGGCSFYSDGRVWRLDSDSSDRLEAFLKQPDSSLHIKADVMPVKGDKVSLTNIKSAS